MEEDGRYEVLHSIGDTHRVICKRVVGTAPVDRRRPSAHDDGERPRESPPSSSSTRSTSTSTTAVQGEAQGRCLALRDFYPFWRENLEESAAGKILPVDLSENPEVWRFPKISLYGSHMLLLVLGKVGVTGVEMLYVMSCQQWC